MTQTTKTQQFGVKDKGKRVYAIHPTQSGLYFFMYVISFNLLSSILLSIIGCRAITIVMVNIHYNVRNAIVYIITIT